VKYRFSQTVSCRSNVFCWLTMADDLLGRAGWATTSIPRRTPSRRGMTRVVSIPAVVVFPAPFGRASPEDLIARPAGPTGRRPEVRAGNRPFVSCSVRMIALLAPGGPITALEWVEVMAIATPSPAPSVDRAVPPTSGASGSRRRAGSPRRSGSCWRRCGRRAHRTRPDCEPLGEVDRLGQDMARLVGQHGQQGVSNRPGAMASTRIPTTARSRAAGSVMPTIAPLEAE